MEERGKFGNDYWGEMKKRNWKPKRSPRALRAESRRLVLRPYRAEDYWEWRAALLGRLKKQNDFDSGRPSERKVTRSKFVRNLEIWKRGSREGRIFVLGIFDRKTGANLGSMDLFILNPSLRWANLGYQIHNQFWNQGYATEAAKLALKLAFGPLDLHRVEAGCELSNRASARVALKAGLIPEGVRRKFFAEAGGVDLKFFGANALDYLKRRSRRRK